MKPATELSKDSRKIPQGQQRRQRLPADLPLRTKAGGTVARMGQIVLVNRIRFSMDDIRTTVHGLYDAVNARLRRDLLLSDEHPLPLFDMCQ